MAFAKTNRDFHHSFWRYQRGLFCLPLVAQELKGWQSEVTRCEFERCQARCPADRRGLDQDARLFGNARDIEGNLKVYWKSPGLLVVIDAEQF